VIHLELSSDQMLARMRRSTRRNIRHALQHGVRLVEGDEPDLGAFHRLMCALCERRRTRPNPPRVDFLVDLWQQFRPKGWVRLFFARYGDEAVSAALAFTFRDWFRVWKVGWSGEHRRLKPNEGMWWELIQWARRGGFRHFDFVGIDPDRARAWVAGNAPGPEAEDATSFKLGFGGEVRLLPGAYYYVFHPVIRAALRWGLGSLFQSPVLLKLVRSGGRFWR